MEAKGLSQWAYFEDTSEEEQDGNTNDSKEVKEEEEKTSLEEDYLPFLNVFPAQKAEIEKCIQRLREIAEAISKTHKDCTIANITASSAGVTSGILNILGLTLTPFTAGASLILTATGLGLGGAAATTSIFAQISEQIINSKHSKQSQELIKTCEKGLAKCMGSLATLLGLNGIDLDSQSRSDDKRPIGEQLQAMNVVQHIPKMVNTVKGIKANVKALELARANPALKVLAKQASGAGSAARASLKGIEQVETAFKGTALALSKGTRIMGAVTVGLFMLYDTFSIVQDAIHLAKGAKPEKTTQISDAANKLEKALQDLSELHDQLKERHRLQSCTLFGH